MKVDMRIRLARVARDWTQADLGKRAGIGQWDVSKIEQGWLPPLDVQRKVARAFGMQVDELFGADELTTKGA